MASSTIRPTVTTKNPSSPLGAWIARIRPPTRPRKFSKELGENPFVDLEVLLAEEHEADKAHVLKLLGFFDHRAQRDLGGFFEGVTEGAGREGGESQRVDVTFLSEPERVPVAIGEELGLGLVGAVDRPQSVDHVAVRQVVTAGYDRFSGLYRGQRSSLFHEPGTRCLVYRTRYPSPTLELGVGRIHDRIHVALGRYVALDDLDPHPIHRTLHAPTAFLRGSASEPI